MHEPSDFRSDTVTRPSAAMRAAMAAAPVGDDVLGDDPTVRALEAETAALLGKEAGLFVPSGSMGNLLAVLGHARPGEEVLLEEWGHTANFEAGGAARFGGVLVRTLPSSRGRLDPDLVKRWIRPGSMHTPRTALLVVENTHNFHGGSVIPADLLRALGDLCRGAGVAFHCDGARLWNAAAASGAEPAALAAPFDSVSVCLSKGLGAPVGSVLCGTAAFVDRARRDRKALGGGMRQAGLLAEAGRYALRHNRARLSQDHERARRIAGTLAQFPGFSLRPEDVETNIVFSKWRGKGTAEDLQREFAARGVLLYATAADTIRLLTHMDVDDDDEARLLQAARAIGGRP